MLSVLIAEDDLMIADMIEEILILHGYEVCGIARTVSEAVDIGRRCEPDLAVIDLRLADARLGTEIIYQLGAVSRPGVLYASANLSQVVLSCVDGDACLAKPYRFTDLLRGLQIVADIVATGTTASPLPHGLHVLGHAPIPFPTQLHG
ncbi:MAG TPA: response regulator [Aliidongia sp.]|nr:response regulator [Aliidongia sp.]